MFKHIWSDEDIKFVKRAYRNQPFPSLLNLSVPEELRDGLTALENNMRFSDPVYCSPGIVIDSTQKHSLRGAYRFEIVPNIGKVSTYIEPEGRLVATDNGSSLEVEKGKNLLLRHDFIERFMEDISSNAEEADHRLAEETFSREEEIAKEIFDEENFKIFQQFQIACRCLSEVSEEAPEVMEALVARLIDHIDGDCVFYYQFTRWLIEGNIWDGEVPPASLFTNYMWWFNRVLHCFDKPKVPEDVRNVGIFLVHDEARFILECWEEVPEDRIPKPMLKTIGFIRERLEKRKKVHI